MLFKGFPDTLNEHFHNWHERLVLDLIREKNDPRILDVGCGYGRLSMPIIKKYPHVDITGIDISETYIRLYRDSTNRPAFLQGVDDLSCDLGVFDCIICVTVLMYLDDESLKKGASNLLSRLKSGGKLLVIEPHSSGIPFQTGFGVAKFFKKAAREDVIDTKGRCFRKNEIEELFKKAGAKILSEHRLPVTSVSTIPLLILCKLLPRKLAKNMCKAVSLLDQALGKRKLPSISAAYVITRD